MDFDWETLLTIALLIGGIAYVTNHKFMNPEEYPDHPDTIPRPDGFGPGDHHGFHPDNPDAGQNQDPSHPLEPQRVDSMERDKLFNENRIHGNHSMLGVIKT